jgi:hypothetical protein
VLIDVGMIASTILFPMTTITNMEQYASSFSSVQMLPFVPSLMLGPVFVALMLAINHTAPMGKKIYGQLAVGFAVVCADILSLHYYIQLTIVQQGILSGEIAGLWQFVTPNPHSFFWTFAALGYGFMGFSVLAVVPVFADYSDRKIKWLLLANAAIGIAFLVGNALGFFIVDILVSFVWGVLFPVVAVLLAKRFKALK